jgi:hypothetical protein
MYKDIKNAHNKEKIEKERKRKQRPVAVMKHATKTL